RNEPRMPAHPAPRGRARAAGIISTATPASLAGAVRPIVYPLPRLLPAEPGKPPLRPAPAALVRAEPSGRGLCRDLRGVAHPALELAQTLRRLAGAQAARIC